MKKLPMLLLLIVALLLAGCSDGGNTPPSKPSSSQTTPADSAAPPTSADDPVTSSTDSVAPSGGPSVPVPSSVPPLPSEPSQPSTPTVSYTVRTADWTNLEWESYSNVYFTLTVPKGWKVEWNGNAQQLEWSVRNPEGNVGVYNLDHNYAAKDASMKQTLGQRFYLRYGTVQEYFETVYADTTNSFVVLNSCVPDNKAQLQAARPSTAIRDYQSLYAYFEEDGLIGEGIYSAVVMESPDVYVRGQNYGLWEINCTFTEWSPRGELVNWQPVLSKIAQSFAYTDYYVQEWINWVNPSGSPDGSVGDSVLEAFEERDRADTILQEKRSDMLGEYERVYDNETGEIYRAYLGFLDDLGSDQTRYTPVTDDQYADGYVGYIDRG